MSAPNNVETVIALSQVGVAPSGHPKEIGAGIAAAVFKRMKSQMAEDDVQVTAPTSQAGKAQLGKPPVGLSVETRLLLKELRREVCDDTDSSDEFLGEQKLAEDACCEPRDGQESDETCDEGGDGVSTDPENQLCVDEASGEEHDWDWQSMDSLSSVASLCTSTASLDSLADFYSPEETLIIFDWDDTICPTTVLNSNDPFADSPEEENEAIQELIQEARLTLEKAREVAGEVVVVTNATDGWLEASCERWLPGLRPTLDMLEFTSARSIWEPTGIVSPTGWKAAAFEDVIRKFYSRYPNQTWKNIIVIGDSSYEHEALDHVATLAPQGENKQCRAKSIKFTLQPSVGALTRELQMLRESFDEIVCHDDSLDLQFNCESL